MICNEKKDQILSPLKIQEMRMYMINKGKYQKIDVLKKAIAKIKLY